MEITQAEKDNRKHGVGDKIKLGKCVLTSALSLAAFSPALRTAASTHCESMSPEPVIAQAMPASVTSAPVFIQLTEVQLQQLIQKVVAESQAQMAQSSSPIAGTNVASSSKASSVVQVLQDAENSVSRATGGWGMTTIVSACSTAAIAGMGLSVMAMPYLKRYPGEFEVKIADLKKRGRAGEEYGVEPLFGRTEVEALLGKPKSMSNRFMNFVLPERWALMHSQISSKFWADFPFLRFNDTDILRALSNFLKINAASSACTKQSIRDAHGRLVDEVKQLDGKRNIQSMNPLSEGEEVISVITYERWRTKINRVLTIPSKDLCALLINPKRYLKEITEKYPDLSAPEAQRSLEKDLTGYMRKLDIAVGIAERAPEILRRYLAPTFPKSLAALELHAKALKPLLVLNTSDGISYLMRYLYATESATERHSTLLKHFVSLGSLAAAARPLGEITELEQRRLSKLWNRPPPLPQRLSSLTWSALGWVRRAVDKSGAVSGAPAMRASRPYTWFVETTFPDPSL